MTEFVIVKTRYGQVRGAIERSFEGYNYCSFKGIPYAKPPVDELRFSDPIPAEPWSGLRDALNYGPACGQNDPVTRSFIGSDDCLYLNVYVRSVKSNCRLPVMVWIHGGAFIYGSSDDLLYGPDYLLKKDIVLVTFNYRLGVLGFLNFDDEAATGNQGLKDQVVALRWVQENIKNFGGDPDNVTIFGESAGGASVHYLALSTLTKGLFHKAISQSGVSCNSWAYTADNTKNAYKLCKYLGNNSTDSKELVNFLRTVDCRTLLEAQSKTRTYEDRLKGKYSFGPGVDDKSKEPLMKIHPSKAAEEGVHVPYILGSNTMEGSFFVAGLKQKDFDEYDQHFEKYLNPRTRELLQRNNLAPNELKKFYFGTEKISENNANKFINLASDIHMIEGIHWVLKAQAKRSSAPTYFYNFAYDKETSITKILSQSPLSGTAHFDEVQFQFSMRMYNILNIQRPKKGSTAYRVIEQMTEMWVNFAKYGRPTPETSELIPTFWLPINDDKIIRTLNINEELRMINILNIEEILSFGKHAKNKL